MGIVGNLVSVHASSRHLDWPTEAKVAMALMVNESLHLFFLHSCAIVSHSEMYRQCGGYCGFVWNHVEVEGVLGSETVDLHLL